MEKEEAIQTLNVMQSRYAHIRHSDSEWEAVEEAKQALQAESCVELEDWASEWREYTGADAGFHYCSKCSQQAFNYEDGREVVEVLSDFCPSCGRAMNQKSLGELEKRLTRCVVIPVRGYTGKDGDKN